MALAKQLRELVVDSPDSLGAAMRRRRWNTFLGAMPDLDQMRVLDLGGTVDFWALAPVRPKHVTVLNLFDALPESPEWITPIVGDACDPPPSILEGYDLAYSNSVIEHVGGYQRRQDFANVIRRVATRYWVQTPYRYFPIEPHWLFPGAQFMPVAVRTRIVQSWPLMHSRPRSKEEAREVVLSTDLIGRTEMRHYFPDAKLTGEKIAGVTKSLIAFRP